MSGAAPARLVWLLDVDNTLLDNDAIEVDLREHLTRTVGAQRQQRYWAIFERHRAELGYADYLGALQRFRLDDPCDQNLLTFSSFLVNYPFASRLYPRALDVVAYLDRLGTTVILSDGDVVFQPLKIERSGLGAAVGGRVLVYVHKEQELDDIARRYPAERYVLVDDKIRLLTAFKQSWGARITTIFPRQGHYATDPGVAAYPPADISIDHIGDLLDDRPLPGTPGWPER